MDAYAWDGQRKGFILGFGVGPGFTTFTQKLESSWFTYTPQTENRFAVMTDFKMGYAPTNSLGLYWTSKVSWFGLDGELYGSGLGAVGVTYFSRPEAPSAFFSGGLGFSSWGPIFEDPNETLNGFGIALGAGYEFTRYWNVEVDVVWGNPSKNKFETETSTDALGLKLTVNVLGY